MEYEFWKPKEHIKERSMWAGSQHLGMTQSWIYSDGSLKKEEVLTSKALIKIIDELRVNSLDQYVRFPKLVGNIKMSLSKNGEFSIFNDGPGFGVYFDEKIGKYSVEGLFTKLFSSSNFKKNMYRVTGGLNGCGLKVVIGNCLSLSVETYDETRKVLYKQTFSANGAEPPEILNFSKDSKRATEYKKGHTKVTLMPDYKHLCKEENSTYDESKFPEILSVLDKIVHGMAYFTALFINNVDYRTDNSSVNDEGIGVGTEYKVLYKDKAKVFYQDEEVKPNFELNISMNLQGSYSWKVYIGINEGFETFSLINGVIINGGSHINLLFQKILKEMEDRIQKKYKNLLKFKTKVIKDALFIADMRFIPIPNFEGQTKNSIDIDVKTINKMRAEYNLPKAQMDQLFELLVPIIEGKEITQSKKTKKIRKYEKAEMCRKEPHKCFLFIPEGDSAEKPIQDIIHSAKTKLDGRYYGTFNIQGVPPNAKKETTIINGRILKSKMLSENKSFTALMEALNLDYRKKYISDEEFKTLNYAGIIIATDQDVDGIGHITSLILIFILCFWPDLVKRGFVKRLATPLIRVYNKKDVKNFYSEKEFEIWLEQYAETGLPKSMEVKYYKGLAGHSEEEVISDIGKDPKIYTFTYDDLTEKFAEIFYGKEPLLRKIELSKPLKDEEPLNLNTKEKKCSSHFEIEAKTFQLEFINRKMKNVIDGFIPVQRKAFAAGRKFFGQGKHKNIKVYQLTGYVTTEMMYQHGDTSMNETITKMAQNFTGTNQLPVFTAKSNGFGGRKCGRGKTGSPRYIDVGYNKLMDYLFPPIDDNLLLKSYEEGQPAEPLYYCPIVPYSILETSTTTSVGWKIDIWARDFKSVLTKLRLKLRYGISNFSLWGKIFAPKTMSIYTKYGQNPVEFCTGSYKKLNNKSIQITELPLKMWSEKIKDDYLDIPEIIDIHDKTADDKVNVVIEASADFISRIDPIKFFGLEQKLSTGLNLVKPLIKDEGKLVVGEFKNYDEIFDYWFEFRKNLYILRLDRIRIFLSLKLEYYTNIRNFIYYEQNLDLDIDMKEDEERHQILSSFNIKKFNKKNLFDSYDIKTEELEHKILVEDATYDYIDSITVGDKSKKKVSELEEKIRKIHVKLLCMQYKTWTDLWLEELTALEEKYEEGVKTKFLYEVQNHTFS